MKLIKVEMENVRSFIDEQSLSLDGSISIIIGPNGGGKTNLLDIIVISIKRYLQSNYYFSLQPSPENPKRHAFTHNDMLTNMVLEKHSNAIQKPQKITMTVEVTASDIKNMKLMQDDFANFDAELKDFQGYDWGLLKSWDSEALQVGSAFTYTIMDGSIQPPKTKEARDYYDFLHNFDNINFVRSKNKLERLSSPVLYFPVNRSSGGLVSSVSLAGYDDIQQKRQADGAYSRHATSLTSLAVNRLAASYRIMQEDNNIGVDERFYAQPSLRQLRETLEMLGYTWKLECTNPLNNQYELILTKQGVSFNATAASSGERELLNYVFSIYVLNIRDALVVVDEPELHLHPRWQKILLSLFERLSSETGNQFLLATHSPAFVSPESIQYISRVYSKEQKSNIERLNKASLPNTKLLFNIVNSQNNEKIFFADKVVLVEGISDRIVFSELLKNSHKDTGRVIEVVSVGGKSFFTPYEKLLDACKIDYSLIADLDYIEQVGSTKLKKLFKPNNSSIKSDIIDNVKSMDGDALVSAIDEAFASNNWDEASELWQYIKSRRKTLIPQLDDQQKAELNEEIDTFRNQKMYILKQGAIEQYLPSSFSRKNLEGLIELVSEGKLLETFLVEFKGELEEITALITHA
ncbi:AAA family ATPase [Pseudomonas fluorescens]|jgi:putative ATP-dependent endonuclease of the OLD family|uniref:AAA family ATPase n=1 Tax=Pseudomonas fluorescens TaxID=294 RepID=UPI0020C5199A|nr:AAA family ATPase [Pseudomonas fluorescens]UTL90839.1 AAA family ATPase [Pseudomonas fluorescens]